MLVRDRMSTPAITITPKTSLGAAMKLMRERRIRRVPVLQHGRLVGIVTWTDLVYAQPSKATTLTRWEIPTLLDTVPIQEVMARPVETISPDATLEEAATIMRHRKIGGLPVVKDGSLVGIVTESDIFDAFVAMLGAQHPSYRITLDIDDGASALPDITAAFRLLFLRLHSVSTYPGTPGRIRVVVRTERSMPLPDLVAALQDRGLTVAHATDGGQTVFEGSVTT